MDKPFVRVVDTHKRERIINLLQVIELCHGSDSWEVWMVKGDDPIRLAPEEADKLFRRLPGAEPTRHLNAH
jgi:hypothetical protein